MGENVDWVDSYTVALFFLKRFRHLNPLRYRGVGIKNELLPGRGVNQRQVLPGELFE